jgi:hypothetical protein
MATPALSSGERAEVIQRVAAGERQCAIARDLGVSDAVVSRVVVEHRRANGTRAGRDYADQATAARLHALARRAVQLREDVRQCGLDRDSEGNWVPFRVKSILSDAAVLAEKLSEALDWDDDEEEGGLQHGEGNGDAEATAPGPAPAD